jgi:Domain of unknown function (DUF5911)
VPSEPGNERLAMERVAEVVKEVGLSEQRLSRLKTAVAVIDSRPDRGGAQQLQRTLPEDKERSSTTSSRSTWRTGASIKEVDGPASSLSGYARYPPIDDYALIGDRRSAGLISREGSLDWLCLPRFDTPSTFAAVLDAENGGRFLVRPLGEFRTERRYSMGCVLSSEVSPYGRRRRISLPQRYSL